MQRSSFYMILLFIGAAALFFLILGLLIAPKARAEAPSSHESCLCTRGLPVFYILNSWGDNNKEDDWDDDWEEGWDDNRTDPEFRYNRVEGIYLGLKVERDYLKLENPTQTYLFGSSGYSFAAKEFEYQLGLEKGVMEEYRLAFGGEYHRLIDTPDQWIIGNFENSLAAFFLKEDFQDFYMREGGSAYIEQFFTRYVKCQVGYHYENLDSIKKHTNWALFGGKKKFRPNPLMSAGDLSSIQASMNIDTRNSKKHPNRGWYIQLEGEHSLSEKDDDFDFDRLVADIRRYQPLGYGEGVDFRIRAGSITGQAPWHGTFHLGGISTLRGYNYKAFPDGPMKPGGNRMLLGQVEFRIGSEVITDALNLDVFDLNRFVIFADAGWVNCVDAGLSLFEGFDDLRWSDFKSDVGLALTDRDGNVRVEIARRTDTSVKPFTLMIRIKRDF